MKPISAAQIRNALQVGFAGLIAAAIYEFAGLDAKGIEGFYIIYGVARSLLLTPEVSFAAARDRIVGTIFGGVIVALLILVLKSWLAVGIGYILIQILGRKIGLNQPTLMNASIMAVLLLAVPGNTNLGGLYVFERTIWHLVGLFIGMLIERLFWFRSETQRLQDSEQLLVKQLQSCLLKAEVVSSEDLILSYAKHCKIKSIAYRDCKIDDLKFVSLNEREELLEIALRHAVALGRVPAQLRKFDQIECSIALASLEKLLTNV